MPISETAAKLQKIQELVSSIMTDVEVTEDPQTHVISVTDLVGSGDGLELAPERVHLENGELPLPTRTKILSFLASRQS